MVVGGEYIIYRIHAAAQLIATYQLSMDPSNIPEAIALVLKRGKGCILVKRDLSEAFCRRLRLFMSICIDYIDLSTLLRRTMWIMMHA